jgi:2,5-dihydroxypyridine 5,6-dioxygenase
MRSTGDLTALFRRQFELCNVREGEVVAILTEPASPTAYVDASIAAAGSLGAHAIEIAVGALGFSSPTPVKGMGAGVAALSDGSPVLEVVAGSLERADFVIDLVRETIIHLPLRERLIAAGVRSLTIVEPPDILERMISSPEIKQAAQSVGRRLEAASSVRVTSPAGTELSYGLNTKSAFSQYGYADEPGKWDHWPSALAVCYPDPGTAHGKVVLAPGDIVFPFKRYVSSDVVLTIEDGYVVDVEGALDAQLIEGYLDSWEQPEVYAVSHIGFGVHPRAQWSALEFYDKDDVMGMDGRSYPGNFIFSTGPDRFTGRLVQAHLDIPMRGCTVHLDDDVLVEDGVLREAAPSSAATR